MKFDFKFSIIFISLLLFVSWRSHAQSLKQTMDSLENVLKTAPTFRDSTRIIEALIFARADVDPATAMKEAENFLKMARLRNDRAREADALNAIGHVQKVNRDFSSSMSNQMASAQMHKELGNTRALAIVYTNLGATLNELGEHQGAIEMLLEAADLPVPDDDRAQHAHVLNQLAIAYRDLGNYRDSEKYFNKSIDNWKMSGLNPNMYSTKMSLGILYTMMKEYKRADSVFASLIPAFGSLGKIFDLGLLHENMGTNFMEMGDYPRAEIEFGKAMKIWQEMESDYDIGIGLYDLSENFLRWKKYNEAWDYGVRSLSICDSLSISEYSLKNNENLAELYEYLGQPDKALHHMKLVTEQRDSLRMHEKDMLAMRLQAKYGAEQKEKEIELLQAENDLAEANTAKQKLYTQISIGGALILLLIGFLIFNRYRTNLLVRELELRNKIASDLHDDVGSSLSSIRMLSEFAADGSSLEKVKPILDKISGNAKETVERISDIVWSINPRNDIPGSIALRMRNYLHEICSPVGVEVKMIDTLSGHIHLNMQQKKNTYLIFKEAVNNSLKYAEPKTVVVSLHVVNKRLVVEISDDGKGFDPAGMVAGNGLSNMKMRANEMNGEISILSQPGHGTSIQIQIPITHIR